MDRKPDPSQSPAAAITRSASSQTYFTIRLFVDRERVPDAYRAYGYFRWLDDVLDEPAGSQAEKIAFVNRQQSLLEACYRGEHPSDPCPEERMLVDLIRNDVEANSGLQAYLRHMMAVMAFDARRRGRVVTQAELSEYSRRLATAVTEALHHFIGHDDPPPPDAARYLAVTAAHITHMLRDAFEDADAGYFNIPREYLDAHGMSPRDVAGPAYREWVRRRVRLAHRYFQAGRACLARVPNRRCRLAGYAYVARFEWMLRAIEGDDYCLRSGYRERKGLRAGLWMGWEIVASALAFPRPEAGRGPLAVQTIRVEDG